MSSSFANGGFVDYAYPGQFILGPEVPSPFRSWPALEIDGGLTLVSHPGLNIKHIRRGGKVLVLIGYLLDPAEPDKDDNRILLELFDAIEEATDITHRTEDLAGRWIMIAAVDQEAVLVHDAAGTRRVVYTGGPRPQALWCASQPSILAEFLDLRFDRQALSYIRSHGYRSSYDGKWWPGMETPFSGVHRLLPNHSLNLKTGLCARYWPNGDLQQRDSEEVVLLAAETLAGLIRGAAGRYELTLLITAGMDSRTILAACRPLRDQLDYLSIMTHRDDIQDCEIPARLLASYGCRHNVAVAGSRPSRRFWKVYRRNCLLANRAYAVNAEAILPFLRQQRVAVTGHVAEIGQAYYSPEGRSRDEAGPEQLAALTGRKMHPYVGRAYDQWIEDAAHRHNVPLLDLFYWEQRMGSWLASWTLEYDLIWRDVLHPFNCRKLLAAMLGVEVKLRQKHDNRLLRAVVCRLWPELLDFPAGGNQPSRPGVLSVMKRTFLRNAGRLKALRR